MELLTAFTNMLSPSILLFMTIGVLVGALIGALPGLSVTMAIAILTPITFWLEPAEGLAMLIGIYNAGVWAGGISAILINTPGTPASIMTCLDGYEMTKRGEAGLALGINTIFSVIGGIFSSIVLMVAAFPIADLALTFGPPEYFALALFGLSMIIGISEHSVVKGVIMGCLGFLIATAGLDSMYAFPRFTFGNLDLLQGVPYVAVMIGLFGIGEVLTQIFDNDSAVMGGIKVTMGRIVPTLKQFKQFTPVCMLSAVISVIVGAVPGTGGDIASVICWDQAKKLSKDKKNYGKGSPEALAVTCLANNGVIGGAMTTMLTLGIPGDAATAVLIGSLMMYGMQPGPMLFIEQSLFVREMMAMMIIANVLILILGMATAKASAKFLNLKQEVIWIGVLIFSIIGSYAINNSLFDVWVMLLFGVIGFFLRKMNFPIAPLILGVILGPMAESNFRRSLSMSMGDYSIFLVSPISLVLISLTVLALAGPVIGKKIKQKKQERKEKQEVA